jgi:hypothetical protein
LILGYLFDYIGNKCQHQIENGKEKNKVKYIINNLSPETSGGDNADVSGNIIEGVKFKDQRKYCRDDSPFYRYKHTEFPFWE